MKKSLLPALFLFLCIINTNAQSPNWQWARSIGSTDNDEGKAVALDAGGNVYTTGYFIGTADFDPGPGVFSLTSAGSHDIFISKLDNAGNFVWAVKMGGTSFDEGNAIAVDVEGNIYTTGNCWGAADFDPGPGTYYLNFAGAFVSKLDSMGNFVWAKPLSGSSGIEGEGIKTDVSGNVYTTGKFFNTVDFDPDSVNTYNLSSATSNVYDIFISKLDTAGNFVWAKRIGGIDDDFSTCIALDDSGNVYTTGSFRGTVDFDPGVDTFNLTTTCCSDIFECKLNTAGNFVWATRMGGVAYSEGESIAVDASGNVYTTGHFQNTVDFDPGIDTFNLTATSPSGTWGIFVSKIDSSGNFVWAKAMGGTGDDGGKSIAVDASENVYTTGFFLPTGNADFDPDSGTFILTPPFGGGQDGFISKLDTAGAFVWAKAIGQATGWGHANSITLDAFNNVYLTGLFAGTSLSFGSSNLLNVDTSGAKVDIFIAKLDNTPTGMVKNEAETGISVFPNPFTSSFTIHTPSQIQNGHLKIFNVLGKKMYAIALNSQTVTINCIHFFNGVYFVKITGDKTYKTVKVIKN